MEQFRLVVGFGLMILQLGVASLLAVLFLKTRGEKASRYWAAASLISMVSTLISGFLPAVHPAMWMLYLSATLTVVSMWIVWRGFRSYRDKAAPWWGWAVPGSLTAVFLSMPFWGAPQLARSITFTLAACSVLVFVAIEALAVKGSKARWLVALAVASNAVSFLARPALMALGYDVSGSTDNTAGLLATYLVPIADFFLLFSGLAMLSVHKLLTQKEALATLDELTQLPNRRALVEGASREIKASYRSGKPFTLMLVDIDHFKTVNDVSGHTVGDTVLRDVARTLVKACRPTDLVCRYGGDEFVVLCPGTGADQAASLAQRLGDAVRAASRDERVVTVSIGLAAFEGGEPVSWEPVFERADRALYLAKENGRDRAVVG